MIPKKSMPVSASNRNGEPSAKDAEREAQELTAYCINPSMAMPLVPASLDRKWMKATNRHFANRCLPLLIANQAGWFLLSRHKIRVTWTGGDDLASLRIEVLKGDQPCAAVSHFGYGILTWQIPYLFRTPPGYNLLVRGPANWPKDGIYPLEGVVETDWSEATFTMNWKMVRPVHRVTFEIDEPICMLAPQRRGELEAFQPEIRSLENMPPLKEGYGQWSASRSEHNAGLAGKDGNDWQKHYFRGTAPSGANSPAHQTRLRLQEFAKRD